MKLQFDANLEYQAQAVSSVVDLFNKQKRGWGNFSVFSNSIEQASGSDTALGIGNILEQDEEDTLRNLQAVQLRNGLPQSSSLTKDKYDFDIEMETGTGKTYVYLRSIFELNRKCGFTKFIVVVPSIAIKEGVYKTLEITREHFKNLYNNVIYESFVYDSAKLEQVRSFAVADYINIMVINIDAFRRSFEDQAAESKANIIHRSNDRLNGMRPIDLIAETRPVVIIDEPQSVIGTPKSKDAIASLNPLCTFRYSATPIDVRNMIYKLDAVDSFDLGLVKQIEVASFASEDSHNSAYMKLLKTDNKKSPITAKIEIDVNDHGAVKRKAVTVRQGDDLYELSKGREVYDGYIVDEIYCEKGAEYVSFTSKPEQLRPGVSVGDIDDRSVKEQQIRRTIIEHLDKELVMNKRGVKVLSLFFIDRVANYRYYDENGAHKGVYAQIFEKNYNELIARPKYASLKAEHDAVLVHDGYFAVDKKVGRADGSEEIIYKESRGEEGKTAADGEAYSLIMKDKEKLLSFYDPAHPDKGSRLRFIFSHSALREGWDNPNVFQICTLNETNSTGRKRQEIGRGLRLCVNQDGERLHDANLNILTIMANESYDKYAASLQRQYEEEEGIRFGVLEKHTFANISVKREDGSWTYLGAEKSKEVFAAFVEKGYIDEDGRVQDELKTALKNDKLEVPESVTPYVESVAAVCRKVCGSLKIRPADKREKVHLNKAVYLSEDFKELWNRIKYKTTYAVDFSSAELINRCAERIAGELNVASAKLIYSKASMSVTEAGVEATETQHIAVIAAGQYNALPDIVSYLQNSTSLTRRTIVKTLVKSGTLPMFKKNPQRYMEDVAKLIASEMRLMIADGIKYTKIGSESYYAQELFDTTELYGYLDRNMISSQKSVYDYVVYDSETVEKTFAEKFEHNDAVKLYAKLPSWFKIQTPLGPYNPDWAVLIEKDDEKKLFFVVETKGDTTMEQLRPSELYKIKCGDKHFKALGTDVTFEPSDDFNKFIENV